MTDHDGPIILDQPEQIQMFAYLQSLHRLALEINTGLKFRQSTLAAVQNAGITSKRTKKGALKDLLAFILEINPSYEPGETILRALGK
jgi:hypothetical protein